MKTIVISLKSSLRRRQAMELQFRHQRQAFEFFDAIDGHNALRHIHHYDDLEFTLNCGRSASANEIGCYASHLALWRRCAQGSEPFLILEDDAEFCQPFVAGLRLVAANIEQYGFIRLSQPAAKSSFLLKCFADIEIRHCRRVPLLALAYALSPRAANRLLAAGQVVREPVDKYMQRFWIHRQPVCELQPPLIELGRNAATSDIGARLRPAYGLGLWTRRLLRKVENSVRRDCFNLILLFRRARQNRVAINRGWRSWPLS